MIELLRSRVEPLVSRKPPSTADMNQHRRFHVSLLRDPGYAIRRNEAPRRPGRRRVGHEVTAAPGQEPDYRLPARVLGERS